MKRRHFLTVAGAATLSWDATDMSRIAVTGAPIRRALYRFLNV
ncbi:MAG: hypothetical protein NTZ56_17470 [Acidobacteria bacterium]|nr:hypothetical protein [Acidobacteriota bacterium]